VAVIKQMHWLDLVREILRERIRKPLTMRRIAVEVGVHRVYLSAAFRKRHGCTAREFVRSLRMDLARERLVHSEDALRRIASDCGFYDQGALSKTFKQETGLTPSAYRLKFRHSTASNAEQAGLKALPTSHEPHA
jgi:transcriptional regulator GlxA family with amidase domain